MPSPAYGLLGGAFAHGTGQFAMHPLDLERAADYLAAAVKAGMSWADAEQDIRGYLAAKKYRAQWINTEVRRARPLLKPWLQ